jgi:hypothetical protein
MMKPNHLMTDNIQWFSVTRDAIPAVIFGFERPSVSGIPTPAPFLTTTGDMTIGFLQEGLSSSPPLIAVVRDDAAMDLFAWVATYAAEAFPLSQAVRVISTDDWNDSKTALAQRTAVRKDLVWPSLILGEMLGQGDAEFDLNAIPVSRAYACFSFAQARASLLCGSGSPMIRRCAQRLGTMEKDGSFVKRPIAVEELLSMWGFIDDDFTRSEDIRSVIDAVTSTLALEFSHRAGLRKPRDYHSIGLDLEKISSGSLEQRVIEFERVTEALVTAASLDPAIRRRIPLHLASFAIYVGAGTSHISLLDEFGKKFPSVYAWFGLLAGLIGPGSWDGKWLRTVNAIERLVRTGSQLQDPPTSDLCWMEYDWIRVQRDNVNWLKDIPKLYPRLLSVEIVPGATCQFRLSVDSSKSKSSVNLSQSLPVERQKTSSAEEEARQKRKLSLLTEMEGLIEKVMGGLVQLRNEDIQPSGQQPFFLEQRDTTLQKTTQKRIPTKRTGSKKTN